jgi:hypothetical protein
MGSKDNRDQENGLGWKPVDACLEILISPFESGNPAVNILYRKSVLYYFAVLYN